MLTITLPWPSADLSPNGSVHFMAHARAKKAAKSQAWALTASLMGPLGIKRSTWRGPVKVQYTFHPAMIRDRDDDNFAARMKAARDGIALALGINDAMFEQLPVVFGEMRKPACVVITLTPASVVLPVIGWIE